MLCGVDFSDPARRALRVAIALAHQLGEPLTVVTVLHPLLANAAQVRFGGDGFVDDTARDLKQFIASSIPAGATWPYPARQLVIVGDTAKAILDTASTERSSMIIVGTRGLGRTQRLWFGSTTARLLKLTTVPVLAVPDRAAEEVDLDASAPHLKFERIVCGVDLSEASADVARAAFELSRRLHLPVQLIHAIGSVGGPDVLSALFESTQRDTSSDAEQRLEQLLSAIGERAPVSVKAGAAAEVLTAEVASGPPALLVLGLGPAGSTPGATATQVLAESHAPVLAVPPL